MSAKRATIVFIATFICAGFVSLISNGLGFILFAVWILSYYLWFDRKIRYLKNSGINVKGIIIAHEKNGEGDLINVFNFKIESGEIIEGRSLTNSFNGRINSTYDLLYNPDRPEEFIANENFSSSILKIIVAVIVLTLIIVGVILLPN